MYYREIIRPDDLRNLILSFLEFAVDFCAVFQPLGRGAGF